MENFNAGNGTEVTSYLYANNESVPLTSAYAYNISENKYNNCWRYRTSGNGWGATYVYYPNTMQTAAYFFEQGMYPNELEVDVVGGQLTFGIRNGEYVDGNWTIFTGWKLEYYGDVVKITSITLNTTRKTLVNGETLQLEATILPANATLPIVEWKSSNENVATVDKNGRVTALEKGTATITASSTDGSRKTATCTITVTGNSSRLSKIAITEVCNANIDQTVDPSWNYGPWVELYNPGVLGVALKGCWVSDDPQNLQKVHISQSIAIPSKGYKNLWFDHHDKYCLTQLDMKLDTDGGTIYLSDEDGNLIVSQTYPPAIARCSYARKELEGTEWGYSSTPTPEAENDGMSYANLRLAAPEVDQPTQLFSTTLTVCVNIPEGTTLRYTTDGSTPTATHGMTSPDGLFYPDQTTTYRFCLVGEGYLPSPVVTRTYIYKDKDFALPVLSVVSDNDNFYGDDMGIFVRGNGNGRPGNGQSTPCNWNMDWERPVNIEYLTTDGEMAINQEAKAERCGGWSRAWTPYAFKVKANKLFEGQNYIPYQVFSEKPYLKHKTLQIRNGGNDTSCRIKDPALQEIVFRSGIDIDCQAYQPVMHYINGRYAGVINVREPNNKHFVYANYGLDDEEIDQFEMSPDSGYVQKCGTYESMQRWYNLAADCGGNDEAYEAIKQLVDIDEYCNYMAVELYLCNWDWPQNNVKGFKPIMEGGKFRFVLFDLDGSMKGDSPFTVFENKQTYQFDNLYGEEVENYTKEIEFVTIFLNMLRNETFRKQFIDTYCLVGGSVFEPQRCKEIINELANRVSDSQSIWNEVYSISSTPWSTANTLISNLSATRQRSMTDQLLNYTPMKLSGTTAQNVTLSANISEARLTVNNLPVPTNKFNGYLFAPVTLKAEAPAGYKFLGWKLINGTGNSTSTPLPKESEWKYYDQGSLDNQNWTATAYDDASWASGQAPLGYFVGGSRTHNTILDYGESTSSKRPTYYLRKTLDIENLNAKDVFTLNYTIDDGMVVYVNGTEAGRYNMPEGTVTYDTFASSYAHNNPDTGSLTLTTSLFNEGQNVIAVEIHNNAANSSDIYWEGEITRVGNGIQEEIVCDEESYDMPKGNMVLQACYEAMTDEEKEEEEISTSPIVINEVSAGNSIYVNEYFKKDDWVELYNTTDEDIDLEGMYLTDKSEKPTKYQITAKGTKASTIIPAHGYKVIWCSGRETDTELHATFKLNNEDGKLIRIMAKDQSWADSINYCAHNGDQTVGRYPDGGQNIYLMTVPTIDKPNRMNSYASIWEYVAPDPGETHIGSVMASRNGGMSLAYANGELLVKSEENPNVVVTVYTTTGATVLYQALNLESQHGQVSLNLLPNGIYVARAKDSEGNECATKFLKQ